MKVCEYESMRVWGERHQSDLIMVTDRDMRSVLSTPMYIPAGNPDRFAFHAALDGGISEIIRQARLRQ